MKDIDGDRECVRVERRAGQHRQSLFSSLSPDATFSRQKRVNGRPERLNHIGQDWLGGMMTDLRDGHPTWLPRPPTYLPTYPNLPTYLYTILFLSFLFGLGTFFFVLLLPVLSRTFSAIPTFLSTTTQSFPWIFACELGALHWAQTATYVHEYDYGRTNERTKTKSPLFLLTYKRFRCLLIHHGCSEILSLVERAVSCDLYLDRRESDTRIRQSVSWYERYYSQLHAQG